MYEIGDRVTIINDLYEKYNGFSGKIVRLDNVGTPYYRILLDNYSHFRSGFPFRASEFSLEKRPKPVWRI